MKERPILFSAPMVRAIVEGRKTVTRRVVKPHPYIADTAEDGMRYWNVSGVVGGRIMLDPDFLQSSRYGRPGERLWVRETFAHWQTWDLVCGGPVSMTAYRAGRQWRNGNHPDRAPDEVYWEGDSKPDGVKWTPSIHMPRAASRITLEVTGVRVERLQDGEGELDRESRYLAEGINRIHHGDGAYYYSARRDEPHPKNWSDPFDAWRELWVQINGIDSWHANPWVWVVEFKRVEAPAS